LRRTSLNVLLALALLSEGCSWFRRGPKPSPPPPTATKQAPPGPAAPSQKRPVSRTSSGARKTAQPALKPQPAESPPAAAAREPLLGQIMTEEQKAEYRHIYETNAGAANRILSSFAVRKLAGEQLETLARIRSFLQQAAEARATDWSLAANLARRAAVLASELAGRVE
jgi:hypothetical protein